MTEQRARGYPGAQSAVALSDCYLPENRWDASFCRFLLQYTHKHTQKQRFVWQAVDLQPSIPGARLRGFMQGKASFAPQLHSTPGAISWSSLRASRTTGCCENPMPEYQWALQEIAASFAVMQRNLASTSNNSLYKTANMGSQEPCCFGCIYGEGEHLQGLEESYQHLGMRKKKINQGC